MALYFTNTIRIKSGHVQEFLAAVPKSIAIYEKHGVKFHGAFGAVGGEGNVGVYLVSVADFTAWGSLLQKLQADQEFMTSQRELGPHVDGNVLQALVPMPGSAMQ
jgi:hypothetical protein